MTAGGTAPPSAPAPEPSFTKVGAITGFGSVFVEGERFETSSSGTSVRKDELDADEDDLEIGMVVRVRATSRNDNGEWIADDIEFDEDVKGPIDSIGADSLVVVGQTVNILERTHIDDGMTLADFSAGDILEVSGYRNELDEIDALFIIGSASTRLGHARRPQCCAVPQVCIPRRARNGNIVALSRKKAALSAACAIG